MAKRNKKNCCSFKVWLAQTSLGMLATVPIGLLVTCALGFIGDRYDQAGCRGLIALLVGLLFLTATIFWAVETLNKDC